MNRPPGTVMSQRRNPEKTREDLLRAGFEEIRRNGFRSADIQEILKDAGVTKGALYHHFGSKKALGYAVVDETMRDFLRETWIRPLLATDKPIDTLLETIRELSCHLDEHMPFGCPINTLGQEMAAVDDGFRRRVDRLFDLWRQTVADSLAQGQRAGTVRFDVNPGDAATFLVAALEGIIGLTKISQDTALFEASARGLVQYLESLRPQAAAA